MARLRPKVKVSKVRFTEPTRAASTDVPAIDLTTYQFWLKMNPSSSM
jgi:hypothetical protein